MASGVGWKIGQPVSFLVAVVTLPLQYAAISEPVEIHLNFERRLSRVAAAFSVDGSLKGNGVSKLTGPIQY